MGYATNYLCEALCDHANGVATYTPPLTLYWALTTSVLLPTDVVMPAGVEMTGGAYARVAVANDATFWTPSSTSGNATSIIAIQYATATSDYPAIPGWAALDDPTAGNVLYAGPFSSGISIAPIAGQIPTIQAGQVTLKVSGQ